MAVTCPYKGTTTLTYALDDSMYPIKHTGRQVLLGHFFVCVEVDEVSNTLLLEI